MSKQMKNLESLLTDLHDDNYIEFMQQAEHNAGNDQNGYDTESGEDAENQLGSDEKARIYNKAAGDIRCVIGSESRRRRSPIFYTRAVPLVVCILLLSATVATGSGELQIPERMAELFNGDGGVAVKANAMPEDKEESKQKVAIRNAWAVSDGRVICLAYDITLPAGVALDEGCSIEDLGIIIDGKKGSWTYNYRFIECRSNQATVLLNIMLGEETNCKDITVKNHGISKLEDNGEGEWEPKLIWDNSWTVSCGIYRNNAAGNSAEVKKPAKNSFAPKYENKSYSLNETLQTDSGDVILKSINISPLSAEFLFDCDEIPQSLHSWLAVVAKNGEEFFDVDYVKGNKAVILFDREVDPADIIGARLVYAYYYFND